MDRAYRRLLRKAALQPPISVLELGCGTGRMTLGIARRVPVKKVTLVDNNPDMLRIARSLFRNFERQTELITSNVLAFDHHETYDIVHSGGLVEHFTDPDRQRLLKVHAAHTTQHGYCIIFVPTPSFAYRTIRAIREVLGLWIYTDEVPLPVQQLIGEVEDVGLRVVGVTCFWRWYLTEVGVIAVKK